MSYEGREGDGASAASFGFQVSSFKTESDCGLRGVRELGFTLGFEAGEALANVRDLHGVADGGENLGMAALSRCLIALHPRLQRIEAGLQLANLGGQCILQCLADILNHAHVRHFTLSGEWTVGSIGIRHFRERSFCALRLRGSLRQMGLRVSLQQPAENPYPAKGRRDGAPSLEILVDTRGLGYLPRQVYYGAVFEIKTEVRA